MQIIKCWFLGIAICIIYFIDCLKHWRELHFELVYCIQYIKTNCYMYELSEIWWNISIYKVKTQWREKSQSPFIWIISNLCLFRKYVHHSNLNISSQCPIAVYLERHLNGLIPAICKQMKMSFFRHSFFV